MGVTSRRGEQGQMTMELAVALPVLIIVAVIAMNALLFFSQCAVFDRVSREAVRVYATSPGYGETGDHACALVEQAITSAIDASNVEVEVFCSGAEFDLERYTATITFHPTLFGAGLRSEVFGVALPSLKHTATYVVDVYKSGVVI